MVAAMLAMAVFAACGDKEELALQAAASAAGEDSSAHMWMEGTLEHCAQTAIQSSNALPAREFWVDLCLPSGLLWAACNLGANSPEEYGDYYAWGDTVPGDGENWNTYCHCDGSYYRMTKYCYDPQYGLDGYTDTLTVLQPEDDAATVHLGSSAHIPTASEWRELMANTTAQWATVGGVVGIRFSSNANGNNIFLPSTYGRRGGLYWSASLCISLPYGIHDAIKYNVGMGNLGSLSRARCCPIRAVCTRNRTENKQERRIVL